ncbi:histidine phosphatase family protein [Streptomyces sp. TRM 70361]|uniref:histidine phosphatase family protein n=1 Tax=Streptomyces sp. TRM 70361 TaxID=3116553 RepID=UPI002E7BE237|nr:histidine phosphatase family protein [Streptomyces sp. TRM 70361]MEE1940649.1 histidine phosphatase family protein [Streptomyces sp. TRM 70361]
MPAAGGSSPIRTGSTSATSRRPRSPRTASTTGTATPRAPSSVTSRPTAASPVRSPHRFPGDPAAWHASTGAAPTGSVASFADMARRTARIRDGLISRCQGRTVLAVSHVTAIRVLIQARSVRRVAVRHGAGPGTLLRRLHTGAGASMRVSATRHVCAESAVPGSRCPGGPQPVAVLRRCSRGAVRRSPTGDVPVRGLRPPGWPGRGLPMIC